jgi:hypothetical protein
MCERERACTLQASLLYSAMRGFGTSALQVLQFRGTMFHQLPMVCCWGLRVTEEAVSGVSATTCCMGLMAGPGV